MTDAPDTSSDRLAECERLLTTALVGDGYYRLPDTVADGAAALFDRFTQQGLQVVIRDQGVLRPATPVEHG